MPRHYCQVSHGRIGRAGRLNQKSPSWECACFYCRSHANLREDFRESLYRLIGALTRTGVTIVSTVELVESFTELALSPYAISFLSDDIIRMRYVEIGGPVLAPAESEPEK